MQQIQQQISLYHTLFYVCLGLCIFFFLLSLVFFFKFNIRNIFKARTGRSVKKTVQDMEAKNAHTGQLRRPPGRGYTGTLSRTGALGKSAGAGRSGSLNRSGGLDKSGGLTPSKRLGTGTEGRYGRTGSAAFQAYRTPGTYQPRGSLYGDSGIKPGTADAYSGTGSAGGRPKPGNVPDRKIYNTDTYRRGGVTDEKLTGFREKVSDYCRMLFSHFCGPAFFASVQGQGRAEWKKA